MNDSVLKQYLDLERDRLSPRGGDCKDPEKYKTFIQKLAQLKGMENDAVKRVADATIHEDGMYYETPGILWPMMTAFIPAIAMLVIKFVFQMDSALELGAQRWIFYLLMIGCTFLELVASNRNGRFSLFAAAPRIVLLVLCVYYGWVRRVMLFGSDMNWIYANLVMGVAITLIMRMLERSKRVAHNLKAYRKACNEVGKAEALVKELEALYVQLGDAAAEEQNALIQRNGLTWKPAPRKPWFAFERSCNNRYGVLMVPMGYHARTEFKKKTRGKTSDDMRVLYDEVTFDPIDPAQAQKMVAEKKLVPFYELGLPVLTNDMTYRVYRHRWNIENISVSTETYTEKVADRRAVYEFDSKTDSLEWDVYHGKAENHIADSAQDAYWRDKYLDKKKEMRDSLFHDVTRERRVRDVDVDKGDEIAFMQVTTPDNSVVGFYTSNAYEAVEFTIKTLEYRLSPTAVANNEAQFGMLYNTYLRQEVKGLNDWTEYSENYL